MIKLLRYRSSAVATEGLLLLPSGKWLATLELPWKNNSRGISCIPAGQYMVDYLPRTTSGKFKDCYWVRKVPQRDGILFHPGNFLRQIQGCVLVGKAPGSFRGLPCVWSSVTAMGQLRSEVGKSGFNLLIEELI